MIFLAEVGQDADAIAIERGEIDDAHLELADGLQFANQHLDGRRRGFHRRFFEPS
jgi:hypothetical protein